MKVKELENLLSKVDGDLEVTSIYVNNDYERGYELCETSVMGVSVKEQEKCLKLLTGTIFDTNENYLEDYGRKEVQELKKLNLCYEQRVLSVIEEIEKSIKGKPYEQVKRLFGNIFYEEPDFFEFRQGLILGTIVKGTDGAGRLSNCVDLWDDDTGADSRIGSLHVFDKKFIYFKKE